MPAYVLLNNLNSEAQRNVIKEPDGMHGVRRILEEYEANVLHDFHLLGEFDHCTIFEVSDNFRAQKAALHQEITRATDAVLMPAIDLPLFQDMVRREIRTEGPHEWQVKWWAKLARLSFGAAADRWFLKNGGGRPELALQPWYNSLIGGNFPIRRGGGSATLDYSKWLLDQGANLAIFPEGTRSTSKRMSRFKHGVALLALEKNVPVVPCYLVGLNKLRPKGTRDVTAGPVGVHYQPPIHIPPGTPVPEATQMIYDALNVVHQRVLTHGPEAARWDWTPPPGAVEAATEIKQPNDSITD